MKSLPITYSIKNFKAFGANSNSVPLRPITLVFGPNSAGKSSLLHSMLWLNHALRHGELDVRQPSLAADTIDLGGFMQMTHKHDRERRISTEMTFDKNCLSAHLTSFFNIENKITLSLTFGYAPQSTKPCVMDYRLIVDDVDFLSAFQTHGEFLISVFDVDHPILHRRIESLSTHSLDRKRLNGFQLSSDGFLPNGLVAAINSDDEFWDNILPKRMNDLVQQMHQLAIKSIGSLEYVPPLRNLPPRYFDLHGAEAIWQQLFDAPTILEKVNAWLNLKDVPKSDKDPKSKRSRTGYELVVEEFLSRRLIKQTLPSLIHGQMAQISYDSLTEESAVSVELSDLLPTLKSRFFSGEAEDFLYQNENLYHQLVSHELDQEYYEEKYYNETGLELREKSDEFQWNYVKKHLNWYGYLDEEALENGGYWAATLFRRWLFKQQEMLDLMENLSDSENAIRAYLPSSEIEKSSVRREIQLRQVKDNLLVSLQDVGVGISQVLPVLLHAYGSKEKFIAIEQPEIHIHPRLQADIADVFIESALGENQNSFLLETHSEHLILRLLRRIRETTEQDFSDWPEELKAACPNGIHPEDVAVLYVEPGEDGAKVTELPITPDGDFSCAWPSGFFTERSKELF